MRSRLILLLLLCSGGLGSLAVATYYPHNRYLRPMPAMALSIACLVPMFGLVLWTLVSAAIPKRKSSKNAVHPTPSDNPYQPPSYIPDDLENPSESAKH